MFISFQICSKMYHNKRRDKRSLSSTLQISFFVASNYFPNNYINTRWTLSWQILFYFTVIHLGFHLRMYRNILGLKANIELYLKILLKLPHISSLELFYLKERELMFLSLLYFYLIVQASIYIYIFPSIDWLIQ